MATIEASPELAYVIGVLLGDGSTSFNGRQYAVELKAKDKDFCEHFSECLAKVARRRGKGAYSVFLNTQGYWRTCGYSKQIYGLVKNGGWQPIAELFPTEVIMGFADSEGSCIMSKYKKYPKIAVKMRNQSVKLLKYIKALLTKKFGIPSRIGINAKKGSPAKDGTLKTADVFSLGICSQLAIIRYGTKISFSIKRKADKMKEAVHILSSLRYYCSKCKRTSRNFHCRTCGRLGRLMPWEQS